MVVATAALTSPWWFTPAVNTAGIGLIMLNNYMRNRGLSGASTQNPIPGDDSIQWKDGSVGGLDAGLVPSTPNFDKAKENALNTSATTNLPFVDSPVIDFGTTPVETETNVDFAPPPNKPPNNTGNKDDDKYWKAARTAALWEVAGKALGAATREEEVPVTEGPGTQLVRMPDGSVRRVPVGSTPPGATVLSVDGVPAEEEQLPTTEVDLPADGSVTTKVDNYLRGLNEKDAKTLQTFMDQGYDLKGSRVLRHQLRDLARNLRARSPGYNEGGKDPHMSFTGSKGTFYHHVPNRGPRVIIKKNELPVANEVPVTEGPGTELIQMEDGSMRRVPVGG